jgi:hypothetical protein
MVGIACSACMKAARIAGKIESANRTPSAAEGGGSIPGTQPGHLQYAR